MKKNYWSPKLTLSPVSNDWSTWGFYYRHGQRLKIATKVIEEGVSMILLQFFHDLMMGLSQWSRVFRRSRKWLLLIQNLFHHIHHSPRVRLPPLFIHNKNLSWFSPQIRVDSLLISLINPPKQNNWIRIAKPFRPNPSLPPKQLLDDDGKQSIIFWVGGRTIIQEHFDSIFISEDNLKLISPNRNSSKNGPFKSVLFAVVILVKLLRLS